MRRPCALVVDDNALMRRASAALLARAGFASATAADGRAARAWLEANDRPALVVMDLAMPGLEAWSLCVALASHPRLAGVPVVVCSAEGAPRVAGLPNVRGFVAKNAGMARDLIAIARRYARG